MRLAVFWRRRRRRATSPTSSPSAPRCGARCGGRWARGLDFAMSQMSGAGSRGGCFQISVNANSGACRCAAPDALLGSRAALGRGARRPSAPSRPPGQEQEQGAIASRPPPPPCGPPNKPARPAAQPKSKSKSKGKNLHGARCAGWSAPSAPPRAMRAAWVRRARFCALRHPLNSPLFVNDSPPLSGGGHRCALVLTRSSLREAAASARVPPPASGGLFFVHRDGLRR